MVDAYDAKVANWVCAALSIIILLVRLVATRHRDKKFDLASWVVTASLGVLIARIIVVYLYLHYGTSNDVLYGKTQQYDSLDLNEIKAGSVLALVARMLVTTFYWLQICILLLFYSSLFKDIHWNAVAIKACWATIVITYVAVILATFLECRPFRLYWQLNPNPGQCVRGYGQIFAQGVANIVLDLILLVISFPLLNLRNRSWNQTFRVGTLFALGFFCIIICCLRLAYVHGQSFQPVRSFWASVQMLVSTFVANAPTIYGCWKLVKRRKSDQLNRRISRPDSCAFHSDTASYFGRIQTPANTLQTISSRSSSHDEKAWSQHIP